MARVSIFPGHRDMNSKMLRDGLAVTSEITDIVDGYAEHTFTGDVIALEILLNRFNGERGLEDFGELLKLIKE